MDLKIGHRHFAPSPGLTVLVLVLCAVFVSLGRWQWRRGNARQAESARFERGAQQVLTLGSTPLSRVPDYQKVSLGGRFDPAHQFLLDNSPYNDMDGYQVLTPLERPGGQVVLIDRGWVPFTGSRAELPDISMSTTAAVVISGRVGDLPAAGLPSGRAPPPAGNRWPKVTSFPTMAQLSAALGRPLEPRIILLDPQQPQGYLRDWRPPGLPAMQNWAYAFQWWCFAIGAVVMWVILSTKREGERH